MCAYDYACVIKVVRACELHVLVSLRARGCDGASARVYVNLSVLPCALVRLLVCVHVFM